MNYVPVKYPSLNFNICKRCNSIYLLTVLQLSIMVIEYFYCGLLINRNKFISHWRKQVILLNDKITKTFPINWKLFHAPLIFLVGSIFVGFSISNALHIINMIKINYLTGVLSGDSDHP